jgi:hypothetical protein
LTGILLTGFGFWLGYNEAKNPDAICIRVDERDWSYGTWDGKPAKFATVYISELVK